MKEISLKPEDIFKDYKVKKISKIEAIDKLLFLAENGESSLIRVESLKTIEKIGLKTDKIFDMFESVLISDDDSIVRATTLDIIVRNFPEKCESLLIWLSQYEKSSYILFHLFKLLKNISNERLIAYREKILEKYALIYNVVLEEAEFFLEWEYLYSKYNEDGKYVETGYFIEEGGSIKYFVKHGEGSNYRIYAVRDHHVIALNLYHQNIREVPKSISSLSKLTYLNIDGLTEVPDCFKNFVHLRELYLAGSFSKKIPEWLISKVKKKHIFKYIVEGVKYEDAIVLGLLKILGWSDLIKVPIEYDIKSGEYKIDDSGNVIGISGRGIGGIPVEIGNLKSLRELLIKGSCVEFIPESIGELTSLKHLVICFGSIKKIPKTTCNLKSLEYLDISQQKIEKIPNCINLLTSLKYLDLSFNRIDKIPESLCQINSLQEIFMHYNKIRHIPESIQNLQNLHTLYLYDNPIEKFPESLKSFKDSLDEFILDT